MGTLKKANKHKVCMEIVQEFAKLQLLDNAICHKCGAAYFEGGGLWVCCDGCDRWFNVECTIIKKKKVPETYFCEECTR